MKKILVKLGVACMAIAVFASCTNDEKQMKTVVENYMNAMFAFDFKKAKESTTPESADFLNLMEQIAGMQKGEDADKDKAKNEGNQIHFVKVEKTSDTTGVVTFEVTNPKDKDTQKEKVEETLNLKKRDGKWLVHQTKENPMNDMEEEDATVTDDATVAEEVVVAAQPEKVAEAPAQKK